MKRVQKRKKDFLNNKTRRVISITLLVIWTIFIFKNSMEPAVVSSEKSVAVTSFIGGMLSEKIVRKCAHIFEYAVLGTILGFIIKAFDKPVKNGTVFSLILGLIIAISDEAIQLTSAGRSAQFSDVCIDCCGVIIGLFLFIILFLRNNDYR